jgi:HlyD family secretion protein
MKKAIIIIAAVMVVAVIAFFATRPKASGYTYKTMKVSKGDIQDVVTATGTINAIKNVSVGAQVTGRIKEIYVDFNSAVTQGQLIAQIDPELYQATVDQATANLMAGKANLMKAQASMVDAKRNDDRATQLFAQNLIAAQDRDTADTNYQMTKAAVNAAKAAVVQLEAALNSAQTNLRYTKIISPVDGVVISRNIDIGQTVVSSFQAPTLFLIAQDLTKMQIDTNVNEADIGEVKVDQEVDFTVDAYPEVTFKGKVNQVRNAPITVNNVVTYDVVIYVNNPDLKLKPGMTANTSIITAVKDGILRIPNAALRWVPPSKTVSKTAQKGFGVWVQENNQPKRITVKTGIGDDSYTEMVEGELKDGQDLIVETLDKDGKPLAPPAQGPRMF